MTGVNRRRTRLLLIWACFHMSANPISVNGGLRRSPRIAVLMPINVAGQDLQKCAFSEAATATNLNLHGAAIQLNRQLTAPLSPLRIASASRLQRGSSHRLDWRRAPLFMASNLFRDANLTSWASVSMPVVSSAMGMYSHAAGFGTKSLVTSAWTTKLKF